MYKDVHYPKLEQKHLRSAKFFADRETLVASLELAEDPAIAEIGVAQGNFSLRLIESFNPKSFDAFDLFTMHEQELMWNIPTKELLEGKTHQQYYADRLRGVNSEVTLHTGNTFETLPRIENSRYDLIYVDAGHSYDEVKRDALEVSRLAKPDGVLIFNDYIMLDHHYNTPYGVVQAVNELVFETDWRVIGFALQHQMFCDIALCRRSARWKD